MILDQLVFKEKTASIEDINAHLRACNENFQPPLSEKVDIQAYAKKIFENAVTFEAWSGTSLAGLVAAYLNNAKERTGFITNVSVTNGFMGKGIASKLMSMCLEKSKENNIHSLSLEVFKGSTQAIQLYLKTGFKEYERKGDSVLMTLSLREKK